MNRRTFIQSTAATAAFASPSVFAKPAFGKAEHCVMLWLGGGMSQIDTFDPKPLGDAKTKKAGGYYESIDTSVPGVQVCQHLKKTAKLMEHVTAVRPSSRRGGRTCRRHQPNAHRPSDLGHGDLPFPRLHCRP